MEGRILGDRYCIQHPLGNNRAHRAGQQTFLAIDQQQQQPVVVKLLQFGPGFDWDQLKLFQREAQILQSLNHSAIPDYLDSFDVDLPDCQGFALVQTYIDAPSLEEQLQSGRGFSLEEVKSLSMQLLEILNYLHSHSPAIIHRDLKPSNVLLRNRTAHSVGEVYLVDFGSVQNLVASRGGTMTVVGTYGYMPPEQFGGRAVPASDLYSLGATIIYLLSGVQPADLPQQELRIKFEDHIPKDSTFHRWLRKMIEPALDRRYSSAAQALTALQDPEQWAMAAQGKPVGSRIRLATGSDRLSLRIPRPAIGPGVRMPPLNSWGCIFAFIASWLWILWMFIALGSRAALFMISFLLEKQITIDDESIQQTSQLCGIPIVQTTLPRSAVAQLEVVSAHRQQSNWGTTEIAAEIVIWVGNSPYRINQFTGLTPPEIRWLSSEIGEWLGIQPVNRNMVMLPKSQT